MIKVTDNTPALLAAIDTKIENALTEAGQVVEQEAKRIVPVRTGRLQRSIKALPPAKGRLVVGSDVPYAPFVEVRRPYLRPALHGSMNRIRRIFSAR